MRSVPNRSNQLWLTQVRIRLDKWAGVKNLFELLKACDEMDALSLNMAQWEAGNLQCGSLKEMSPKHSLNWPASFVKTWKASVKMKLKSRKRFFKAAPGSDLEHKNNGWGAGNYRPDYFMALIWFIEIFPICLFLSLTNELLLNVLCLKIGIFADYIYVFLNIY